MDEAVKTESLESHLSSAAAFVEGGIQEACDDACSICLEEFCESDPSTVTGCKHEFHLQCILEWCQRSSQCPMCWQSISLKDPTSQELLEAVEREKSIRSNRSRNTAIFHHPTLGDIELQHLPVGANDAELEERIFQHLAAAAAMGRAHLARREGRRGRSGTHGRPQYLVFSSDPNAISVGPIAASSGQRGSEDEPALPNAAAGPSVPLSAVGEEPSSRVSRTASVQSARGPRLSAEANNAGLSSNWSSSSQPVQVNQDRAGPSDFQSFSESLKSRLSAVSMKYKESITKSTRGWKERFFSRSTSVSDIGSEDRREVNAGIATVSRMIEHLDTRENYGIQGASETSSQEAHSVTEPSNERSTERESDHIQKDLNASASCAAASGSTQVLL